MDKILTLTFLLFVQPVFAFLLHFAMKKLFKWVGLADNTLTVVSVLTAAVLFAIFTFFFARGFLASNEAKKLGF